MAYLSKMKIYTKTGDSGQTSLYSGGRVPKNHLRLTILGSLDELNSFLGAAVSHWPQDQKLKPLREDILTTQNRVFDLGAQFACADAAVMAKLPRLIEDSDIQFLEESIDQMETELEPLVNFILPGGHQAAAQLQIARSVCRRAEREATELEDKTGLQKGYVYLNRLSDYLFVAARFVNRITDFAEPQWRKA